MPLVRECSGWDQSMRDRPGFRREFSAGGVVTRDGKLLVVRVLNLKGERVWTFPKGHVEKGETPRRAAVREVLEETGYRCRVLGRLPTALYAFKWKGRLIRKRVLWFVMRAGARSGRPDAEEILGVRWLSPAQAAKTLRYPSDFKLLEALR